MEDAEGNVNVGTKNGNLRCCRYNDWKGKELADVHKRKVGIICMQETK